MSEEAAVPPNGYVRLQGSERSPRPGFRATGPADGEEPVRVVVKLRPRRQPPDPAVLGAVRPSQRGAYHTQGDSSAPYGADQRSVDAVARFAQEHGLRVEEADPAARLMVLTGPATTVSSAFGTQLQVFRSDETGESYRGRVGPIHIPQPLSYVITSVSGLDNRRQVKPRTSPATLRRHRTVTYTTTDLAEIYEFPADLDGSGQCIGVLEFGGGYQQSDLNQYFQNLGLNPPTVTAVSVDGTQNAPGSDADYEVVLDIEVAGAAAPGAAIAVYFAQFTEAGWVEALTKAVHDAANRPSVLSVSWGYAEFEGDGTFAWTSQAMDEVNTVLAEAASFGITVIAAAGDDGSIDGIEDGKVHVDFPASSPYVLACGGTTLYAAGRVWQSEIVWNRGIRAQGPGHGSTGGGVSEYFPVPAWESASPAKVPPSASTGFQGRGLPDVAAVADGLTGYYQFINGQSITDGGTSAAAPLWAGLIARASQYLSQKTPGARVGYWNPVLYQSIGSNGAFRDITTGNDDALHDLGGAYSAAPGWDPCTGWGTPRGTALISAL
jgi:kumamolisin